MPSLSVILSHPPTTHRGHDPSVNQVQSHVRYQGQSYPRHAQCTITALQSSAQLNPTPTSVDWAEIALISTFTHPPPPPPHPQGKYRAQLSPAQSNSNLVGWANRKQNNLVASLAQLSPSLLYSNCEQSVLNYVPAR